MSATVQINPSMLSWAIARAGYSVEGFEMNFAKKFPYLSDWISTKKEPTLKQLEDFARSVHVPFGYLLLPAPPQEEFPIPFFRTKGATYKPSLAVFDTVSLLKRRQDWLHEYLKDNDYDFLPFVGKFGEQTPYETIVSDIRDKLSLTAPEWAAQFSTWEQSLQHLIQKVEAAGVIVVVNGVVENNNNRAIKVEDCRGFVLADPYAPFVFINNNDAKAAQMFTLVHELAHVWLGKSAGFDYAHMEPANTVLEKKCDQVAAEFLLPEAQIHLHWDPKLGHSNLQKLSKRFKVSQLVVARRAMDTQKITPAEFSEIYHHLTANRNKAASKGGNYYAVVRQRLSPTFARHVHQAVLSEQLLYSEAYRLTGLRGNTFDHFFSTPQ